MGEPQRLAGVVSRFGGRFAWGSGARPAGTPRSDWEPCGALPGTRSRAFPCSPCVVTARSCARGPSVLCFSRHCPSAGRAAGQPGPVPSPRPLVWARHLPRPTPPLACPGAFRRHRGSVAPAETRAGRKGRPPWSPGPLGELPRGAGEDWSQGPAGGPVCEGGRWVSHSGGIEFPAGLRTFPPRGPRS